jgi:hypothetical protein
MRTLLLCAVMACGSRGKSAAIDAAPASETTRVVVDAALPPPPDAAVPMRVHGYRLMVTAPVGWTEGPRDRALPGLINLQGPDGTAALMVMMGVDRKEASDPTRCREAATRASAVGVEAVGASRPELRFESATIVKKTRFGTACKIVQLEQDAVGYHNGRRIETGIYTIGERDMLTFICWSAKDQTDACKAVFDSIEPE